STTCWSRCGASAITPSTWPRRSWGRSRRAPRAATGSCLLLAALRALAVFIGALLIGRDLEQIVEVHRLGRRALVEHAHGDLAVGRLGIGNDVQLLGAVELLGDGEVGLRVVALPVHQELIGGAGC